MTLKKGLSFLFAITLSLSVATVKAQVWELGAQFGGASYMGDLNPTKPLAISGSSIGAFVKTNMSPYWAFGFHFHTGKIAANDAKSNQAQFRQRNLSFTNSIKELSVQVDFNFFDYFSGGGFKNISPYLYTGVGAILFSPKAEYAGTTYKLKDYTTEGEEYKSYALAIPFGAGLKYRVKGDLTLFGNIGFRNAYTDYLDDVSTLYPAAGTFDPSTNLGKLQQALSDRSGEVTGVNVGTPGTQRGDFRKRDSYMFVGIGITYTFVSQKCY